MYAKLFSSLLSSSVWSEDSDTCKVWITLLALADREGYVFGSASGIARICALDVDKVTEALEKFLSPDKHSSDKTREPDRDGKRIEIVDGGWHLLNYAHYRDLADADVRRAQYRASKRKARGMSTNVRTGPHLSASVHPSESSSEAESKREDIFGIFGQFWNAYPKKVGRVLALKAWSKLDSTSRDAAILGVRTYPFSADRQYVPNPASWLNGRRWEDEATLPLVTPPDPKAAERKARAERDAEAQRKAMAEIAEVDRIRKEHGL